VVSDKLYFRDFQEEQQKFPNQRFAGIPRNFCFLLPSYSYWFLGHEVLIVDDRSNGKNQNTQKLRFQGLCPPNASWSLT